MAADESERPVRPLATGPRPLGGLGELAELLAGDSERSRRFLGGLVAGALVGAALAGAALVRRQGQKGRPDRAAADPPDES